MKPKVKRIKRVIDPTQPRNLTFVNLSNDEINFVSSLKIDLIQLQEEIDRLDIDGLLRNPKINTFTKFNLFSHTFANTTIERTMWSP